MAPSLASSLELLTKSVSFDARTLALGDLPLAARLEFLAHKWGCLVRLAARSPAHLRVGAADLDVVSVSDIGTLHACLVDIHDQLVDTHLVGDRPFVVDVGANIGQWTTCFKWLHPEATIVAIEPDPVTFDRLVRTIAPLPDVDARQTAVGDRCGAITLYRQLLLTMSMTCPTGEDSREAPVTVPVTTLDALLDDVPSIDVLKVDVEGGELSVIEGAERVLRRTRVLQAELSLHRGANALDVLARVSTTCPGAHIVKFGRPLGRRELPACQDVVIALS